MAGAEEESDLRLRHSGLRLKFFSPSVRDGTLPLAKTRGRML